jgi:hypothetical protein
VWKGYQIILDCLKHRRDALSRLTGWVSIISDCLKGRERGALVGAERKGYGKTSWNVWENV